MKISSEPEIKLKEPAMNKPESFHITPPNVTNILYRVIKKNYFLKRVVRILIIL